MFDLKKTILWVVYLSDKSKYLPIEKFEVNQGTFHTITTELYFFVKSIFLFYQNIIPFPDFV